MDENKKIELSRFNLEVIRDVATAVGQLKGKIELSEKEMFNLVNDFGSYVRDEGLVNKEIKDELRKIGEAVKESNILLDASPFSKVSEKLDAEKVVLDKLVDIITRMAASQFESQKGRWQFLAAIVTGLLLVLGNIIQALSR